MPTTLSRFCRPAWPCRSSEGTFGVQRSHFWVTFNVNILQLEILSRYTKSFSKKINRSFVAQ